jgi:hypothetical protein
MLQQMTVLICGGASVGVYIQDPEMQVASHLKVDPYEFFVDEMITYESL